MAAVGELSGLKVLVVEDETLICMLIEDMLAELGCTIIGPAVSVDQALAIVGEQLVDAAVLDVNLDGVKSEPVAERLARDGVPFVFATGYGTAGVGETFRDTITLKKPFTQHDLARALAGAIHGAARPSG